MSIFRRKPKPEQRAIQQRHTRSLAVTPTSVDVEKRAFSFVLSTESPVRICGQLPDLGFTDFDEILSADGLDQSRLTGAPIVDSHDLSTVDRIVGVIEAIARDGSTWTGTGRLSRGDKGSRVLADIADGILRQVSVGYTVQSYSVQTRDGQVPLATATAWTPHEVSIVAVGADPQAVIRAADLNPQDPNQETHMDPELLKALQDAADKIVAAAEAADNAVSAVSDAESAADSEGGDNDSTPDAADAALQKAEDAVSAALDAADQANTAVSNLDDSQQSTDAAAARGKRLTAVRASYEKRAKARDASADPAATATEDPAKKVDPANADMQAARSMARKAGLAKLADQLITAGATAREVRSALLDALVKRSEAVGEIVTRPATTRSAEQPKPISTSEIYANLNNHANKRNKRA